MAAPDLAYHDYRMQNVFGEKPEGLRREIVAFWRANRALRRGEAEAWRRSNEVVLVIRNPEGEIAGVTSVYAAAFRGATYYFYRMFIRRGDRVPGMMRFATLETRHFLQRQHAPGGPKGMIVISENPKLMNPGMRRMMARGGFTDAGKTPKGLDIWRFDF